MRVEINKHIVADTEICSGELTFRDTRIFVKDVIGLLSAGITIEEILKEYYPELSREAILASLKLASKTIENERLVTQ